MAQKIRLSCTLEYPDDMHGEDVLSLARAAAGSIGATSVSIVPDRPTFAAVLSDVERVLVDLGFKDMGYVQTMPGSSEDIKRFLRARKELVEISSNDELDKDFLEALLDSDEE